MHQMLLYATPEDKTQQSVTKEMPYPARRQPAPVTQCARSAGESEELVTYPNWILERPKHRIRQASVLPTTDLRDRFPTVDRPKNWALRPNRPNRQDACYRYRTPQETGRATRQCIGLEPSMRCKRIAAFGRCVSPSCKPKKSTRRIWRPASSPPGVTYH